MRRSHVVLFALLVLAIAWCLPYSQAGHSFTMHMAGHMAVVAMAAPLLVFAIAGTRWDPVCHRPRLFSPVVAAMGELVVVWMWHFPALHGAARANGAVFALEQVSFLGAGLWLWLAVWGGSEDTRDVRIAGGIGGLLLTSMHMTVLGAILTVSPRLLYASHHHAERSLLTPLQDQQLGGGVMILWGAVVYLGAACFSARRLLGRAPQGGYG